MPLDNQRLAKLCGQCDEHIKQVEQRLDVTIINRGHVFEVIGSDSSIANASHVLHTLYAETAHHHEITPNNVHLALQEHPNATPHSAPELDIVLHSKKGAVRARNANQQRYIRAIGAHDITFAIGPAGTGKTYLAVAYALQALQAEQIHRILLVRPVVEAGESLGFLPGDLAQKIDPYLRPLFDAISDMIGAERMAKLIDQHIIEVAPLAYMRGRTLADAFIILDESQNCTKEQMKMFLTRVGFGSKVVITGDLTQIDLPKDKMSGLRHAVQVLKNIDAISFNFFTPKDVIRHPLIERIVEAYENYP
jgi:phosphate starvation-inducible protein PhoH and related proteins